jgi:hypothetical protein
VAFSQNPESHCVIFKKEALKAGGRTGAAISGGHDSGLPLAWALQHEGEKSGGERAWCCYKENTKRRMVGNLARMSEKPRGNEA